MKLILIAAAAVAAACSLIAPASPYFTDLRGCTDRSGNAHYFVEPVPINGFYTIEVWQLGIIPTVDEGGAVEVLGGDPPRLHFVAPSVPAQIVWKARGGDNWQPASAQQTELPKAVCAFQ